MRCKDVENLILDFIDNNMSSIERKEILNHLEECNECRHIYEALKFAKQEMKAEFDNDGFEYFDNTKEVMNKINKNRYVNNKKNILRNMKKYKKTLISMAALIVIAFTAIMFILKDDNFKNIGQGVKANKNQEDIHSDFTNKWDIIYSNNGNIIFKNFYKIKAYSKEKGVYFSVDLKSKGLQPAVKSDVITKVSNDGKFIYVFNANDKMSMLVDISNNKTYNLNINFGEKNTPMTSSFNMNLFVNSIRWSENSRYLILFNKWAWKVADGNNIDKVETNYYLLDLKDLNKIEVKDIVLSLKPSENYFNDSNLILKKNGDVVIKGTNNLITYTEREVSKSNISITNNGDVVANKYMYKNGEYKARMDIENKLKEKGIDYIIDCSTKVIDDEIYIALNNYKQEQLEVYKLKGEELTEVAKKKIKGITKLLNDNYINFKSDKLYLDNLEDGIRSIITIDLKDKNLKETRLINSFDDYDIQISKNGDAVLEYDNKLNEDSGMILTDKNYRNLELKNVGKGKFLDDDNLVFIQSDEKDDYNKFKIVSYNMKNKKYSILYNSMDNSKIEFKKLSKDYEEDIKVLIEIYYENLVNIKEITPEKEFMENINVYDERYKEVLKPFLSENALKSVINDRHHIAYKEFSSKRGVYLTVKNEKDFILRSDESRTISDGVYGSYNANIIGKKNNEKEGKDEILFELANINFKKVNDKLIIDNITVDDQSTLGNKKNK